MHIIRETEKDTQDRVIEFFQDTLNYTYLGNWAERKNYAISRAQKRRSAS